LASEALLHPLSLSRRKIAEAMVPPPVFPTNRLGEVRADAWQPRHLSGVAPRAAPDRYPQPV